MEKIPIEYFIYPLGTDNSTIRLFMYVTDDNCTNARNLLLEAINKAIVAARMFNGYVLNTVQPVDSSAIIQFHNVSQVAIKFPSQCEFKRFMFYISL